MATTFAPATNDLQAMHAGLASTVGNRGGLADASWDTSAGALSIADKLILSLFSAIYELAVVFLRVRSRLLAGAAR